MSTIHQMPIDLSTQIKQRIQDEVTDPTIKSEWIDNARVIVKTIDPLRGKIIVRTDLDPEEKLSYIEFTGDSEFGVAVGEILSVVNTEFVQLDYVTQNINNISIERTNDVKITLNFSITDSEVSYFSQLFLSRFRNDPTFRFLKYDNGSAPSDTRLEFTTKNPELYPHMRQNPLPPQSDQYTIYEYNIPPTIQRITEKKSTHFSDQFQIKDHSVETKPPYFIVSEEENSVCGIKILVSLSQLEKKLPDNLVN